MTDQEIIDKVDSIIIASQQVIERKNEIIHLKNEQIKKLQTATKDYSNAICIFIISSAILIATIMLLIFSR